MYYIPYYCSQPYPSIVYFPTQATDRSLSSWGYFQPVSNYYRGENQYQGESHQQSNPNIKLRDYGNEPYVVNIEHATKRNRNFRTALWTGKHLQVTLMSINAGDDIGLEMHPDVDQFLRIEDGEGIVRMGRTKENLTFERRVSDDFAIMVPAGMWHNLVNTGRRPLKLYSIYAPPEHPFGTVHRTKAEAMAAEDHQ
ncbi:cupin domain-containing protein [Bacillus kwashiorkori]|uniref:cupin domain-containing protein n=1 Tax=Bacillus kwashiorkori TaxID=1522318 RepID=UPI000A6117F6|nr:cupin domain-containing protein [Bacillus kwashiorkori]